MNWDPPADLSWAAKQAVLADYFDRYPRQYVIETGVWNGLGSCFQFADRARVTAIEINEDSCEAARRNFPLVRIVQGDSADALPGILAFTPAPAMLWLDAHLVSEAGEPDHSPLMTELRALMEWEHGPDSVILIDDVRMMGREGWPSLDDVRSLDVGEMWDAAVADDIVRLTPRAHEVTA